ncbi:uncharacterized protein EI97DRAFT_83195 [Westerdykella ornata]|uniref:Uncharacterized protein n=1 Tax=Westerdykella ornata TaxID=318751 RepID=A0A6A6JI79_WESOR|nr:uncharacterized protein EI97DRAFT_83195 [Westerdykella ornata]KAF2274959.1 hypothetical protein EI97DRAFT_83195 [Westerdykella ornata]
MTLLIFYLYALHIIITELSFICYNHRYGSLLHQQCPLDLFPSTMSDVPESVPQGASKPQLLHSLEKIPEESQSPSEARQDSTAHRESVTGPHITCPQTPRLHDDKSREPGSQGHLLGSPIVACASQSGDGGHSRTEPSILEMNEATRRKKLDLSRYRSINAVLLRADPCRQEPRPRASHQSNVQVDRGPETGQQGSTTYVSNRSDSGTSRPSPKPQASDVRGNDDVGIGQQASTTDGSAQLQSETSRQEPSAQARSLQDDGCLTGSQPDPATYGAAPSEAEAGSQEPSRQASASEGDGHLVGNRKDSAPPASTLSESRADPPKPKEGSGLQVKEPREREQQQSPCSGPTRSEFLMHSSDSIKTSNQGTNNPEGSGPLGDTRTSNLQNDEIVGDKLQYSKTQVLTSSQHISDSENSSLWETVSQTSSDQQAIGPPVRPSEDKFWLAKQDAACVLITLVLFLAWYNRFTSSLGNNQTVTFGVEGLLEVIYPY